MPLLNKEELIKEMNIHEPPLSLRILVGIIPNFWDVFTLFLFYTIAYIAYGFNPIVIAFSGIGGELFLIGFRLAARARLNVTWVNNIDLLRELYAPRPYIGGLILGVLVYVLILITPWYLYL